MNVEIGTEAAQFTEKEYISGIFLAVHFASDINDKINKFGGTGTLATFTQMRYTVVIRQGSELICESLT